MLLNLEQIKRGAGNIHVWMFEDMRIYGKLLIVILVLVLVHQFSLDISYPVVRLGFLVSRCI